MTEDVTAEDAWEPTPKTVPIELQRDTFHAEPYVEPAPREWATVADQLEATIRDRLIEFAKGIL